MPRKLPLSKLAKTALYWLDNRIRGTRHPFYASFKVTNRCAFTCSFCNIWKMDKKDISTESCLEILRNLGRSSMVMVSFEGGEPLLRKDIRVLLEEARRQPFYVMFTTSQRNLDKYLGRSTLNLLTSSKFPLMKVIIIWNCLTSCPASFLLG